MGADEFTAALTDLTNTLNMQIKDVRKAGDLPAILAATAAALDRLDAALATTPSAAREAQEAARNLAMRLSYNATADAYPGWNQTPPCPPQTRSPQPKPSPCAAKPMSNNSATIP